MGSSLSAPRALGTVPGFGVRGAPAGSPEARHAAPPHRMASAENLAEAGMGVVGAQPTWVSPARGRSSTK